MAKPSGAIIETPITSNFREGLSVLQYFISTHGARKGLADTALKTANSGYLTRRLVDVSQDVIVREEDCGTDDALETAALIEGGEIVEPLGERILGRTALEDMRDAISGELLCSAGQEIDEERVRAIENAGIESVKIRSVLTCASRFGICVKCYGRDLSRGTMVNMGEAVGVIAAQSIGEPGTQLTMRTFHIGGAATRRAEQSHAEAASEGTIRLHNIRTVAGNDGLATVMTRNGEVGIVDASGREKERHPVVYGADPGLPVQESRDDLLGVLVVGRPVDLHLEQQCLASAAGNLHARSAGLSSELPQDLDAVFVEPLDRANVGPESVAARAGRRCRFPQRAGEAKGIKRCRSERRGRSRPPAASWNHSDRDPRDQSQGAFRADEQIDQIERVGRVVPSGDFLERG